MFGSGILRIKIYYVSKINRIVSINRLRPTKSMDKLLWQDNWAIIKRYQDPRVISFKVCDKISLSKNE